MTYDDMIALMKKRGVKVKKDELKIVKAVFVACNLQHHTEALVLRYPTLGFRPFKAAGYVYNKEVWFNELLSGLQDDGIFAEVRRDGNDTGHFVGVTSEDIYFCDCNDYRFNLKALAVFAGPLQQPCCHILATALYDVSILKLFLSPQEVCT